jgi:chromosome partitioning protein
MFDPRTRLTQDVVKQVSAYFKNKVFKSIIPRNIRLSEAPSHGAPISQYDSQCLGARAYRNLALELIRRNAAEKGNTEGGTDGT